MSDTRKHTMRNEIVTAVSTLLVFVGTLMAVIGAPRLVVHGPRDELGVLLTSGYVVLAGLGWCVYLVGSRHYD